VTAITAVRCWNRWRNGSAFIF